MRYSIVNMKQVFVFISTICLVVLWHNSAYSAMLNDSTVVVLTKWNKNEKHIFRYMQYEYEVAEADTLYRKNFNRDFIVEVDDSSAHLYLLTFSRTQLPSSKDSILLDEFPLRLMTNHNGALIKVLNWDAYLSWRKNDVEQTSDDLMPFVAIFSFNGKRLNLNHSYDGSQLIAGHEIECEDSIVSHTKMIATQDFASTGQYNLVTINTTTTYTDDGNNSPIPIIDKFTQVVDSENGWAIATYSERRKVMKRGKIVSGWQIKLLD